MSAGNFRVNVRCHKKQFMILLDGKDTLHLLVKKAEDLYKKLYDRDLHIIRFKHSSGSDLDSDFVVDACLIDQDTIEAVIEKTKKHTKKADDQIVDIANTVLGEPSTDKSKPRKKRGPYKKKSKEPKEPASADSILTLPLTDSKSEDPEVKPVFASEPKKRVKKRKVAEVDPEREALILKAIEAHKAEWEHGKYTEEEVTERINTVMRSHEKGVNEFESMGEFKANEHDLNDLKNTQEPGPEEMIRILEDPSFYQPLTTPKKKQAKKEVRLF